MSISAIDKICNYLSGEKDYVGLPETEAARKKVKAYLTVRGIPACSIMCRKCLFYGACGIFYYLSWFIKSRHFVGKWCSGWWEGVLSTFDFMHSS